MKTSTFNFATATKAELLTVIALLMGDNYTPAEFENRRVKTLLPVANELAQANLKTLAKTLTGDSAKFVTITETPKDESTPKEAQLRIVDMTTEQIMESLTPLQSEILSRMTKAYDVNKNVVASSTFIPEGRGAFSAGGAITTLIEKGIVARSSEKKKSFIITDDFRNILGINKQ